MIVARRRRRWRVFAPSPAAGGKVVILEDGRVIKLGVLQAEGASGPRHVLEISDAEGLAWTAMPEAASLRMKLTDQCSPFAIDGELFLSGELESLSTGGGPSGIEWLNTASGQWEILWQAGGKDNWRDHVGRMLVRRLANGKAVVLPVQGL